MLCELGGGEGAVETLDVGPPDCTSSDSFCLRRIQDGKKGVPFFFSLPPTVQSGFGLLSPNTLWTLHAPGSLQRVGDGWQRRSGPSLLFLHARASDLGALAPGLPRLAAPQAVDFRLHCTPSVGSLPGPRGSADVRASDHPALVTSGNQRQQQQQQQPPGAKC